jgi:hypothetical protein
LASPIPPGPFGLTILGRTAAVWLFLHGAMALLPYMMSEGAAMRVPLPQALVGSPLTLLWLTAATCAVVLFESWRHREMVFLGNLGYSPAHVGGVVVSECVLLDLLLRVSLA